MGIETAVATGHNVTKSGFGGSIHHFFVVSGSFGGEKLVSINSDEIVGGVVGRKLIEFVDENGVAASQIGGLDIGIEFWQGKQKCEGLLSGFKQVLRRNRRFVGGDRIRFFCGNEGRFGRGGDLVAHGFGNVAANQKSNTTTNHCDNYRCLIVR